VCEGLTDEVDAGAVAEGESAITPTQAGTASAAVARRRTARTAIQRVRAPLSTKPQDLQVRFIGQQLSVVVVVAVVVVVVVVVVVYFTTDNFILFV